ncbi:hypothetical protein OIO90_001465 [Microbotryomycetes sp. JL221]|nr:hypothetical protein OIO90_001465 [Microbotryomycetes sp. JL221]
MASSTIGGSPYVNAQQPGLTTSAHVVMGSGSLVTDARSVSPDMFHSTIDNAQARAGVTTGWSGNSNDPSPFGSIGSNRRKQQLPERATTYDTQLATGPTQGHTSTEGLFLPRAPGLYSQPNHSSPSLAVSSPLASASTSRMGTLTSPIDAPVIPALPSLDDINLGLESMRFEQRDPVASLPSASLIDEHRASADSPRASFITGAVGPDGAMEIRGPQGHTASVYSVESVYSTPSAAGNGPGSTQHSREPSNASYRPLPGPLYGGHDYATASAAAAATSDSRRGSNEADAGYLPYDSRYREPGGPTGPSPGTSLHSPSPQPVFASGDFFVPPGTPIPAPQFYPDGTPYLNPDDPRQRPVAGAVGSMSSQSVLASAGSAVAAGSGAVPPSSYPGYYPPQFQPQPPHGMYGYDHANMAAAHNPYYAAAAAATGQPGLGGGISSNDYASSSYGGHVGGHQPMVQPPGSLHRAPSSVSSLSLGPHAGMGGRTLSHMSSVSTVGGPPPLPSSSSSVLMPGATLPGSGMKRKPTSASQHSGTSTSSGPPITKQSVDEYRNRIKADPDPEAQFNFAKYLIEAAKRITTSATGDEKAAKKYRDALLAESLKLIKRLATPGSTGSKTAYADAQFFLANCLGNGSLGLQVDHEKAYNLYVQASKQNHSSATYRTAVCNEVGVGTRRDHARAVLFYRKASALGDTAGMYKLGMILLNGLLGQQRNPREGYTWLKRAASQADEDNPHALHELGLLYERQPAPGQPQFWPFDPAQARELFTQAGQLGYPPSQFKLGSCYEYGSLTCPVDPRRSIAWYTRAAERGDAESELALSGWYLTGSEGVLKQSDSEAYLWARRAANKGLPKAEYAVGYYSEVGIGVRQDLEEAKRWYMRAAAQGNKRAMQRLTELKKLGTGKGGKASRPTRQEAATECVIS